MRVLAFRHAAGEDLGAIRPILESRGAAVECVDLYAGAPLPGGADAAGLIFMGGPMCANDGLDFLKRETELIQDAAARGRPVFGVCLGAQLIARALGGKVHRNAASEQGWLDIRLTEAAAADRLFSRLAPVETVFHLHDDMFEPPPGAALLAGSDRCPNQAFRTGEAIYGLQFHPEMMPAMVEEWRSELRLSIGDAPPGVLSRLREICEVLLGGWSGFL